MEAQVQDSWLTVNRACNMRCPWCYQATKKFATGRTLHLSLGQKLLEFLSALHLRHVVFIGGEPTIYPYLATLIKMAKDINLFTAILTNGIRLSDRAYCKKLHANGLDAINISFKGFNEDQYRTMTGANGFQKVLRGIENIREFQFQLGFEVVLVTSLIDHLEELRDMFAKYRITNVNIDLGSPVVSSVGVSAPDIPDPQVLGWAVGRLHNLLKNTDIKYGFTLGIPLCVIDPEVLEDLKATDRISRICHVIDGRGIVFDENGYVLPCNPLAEQRLLKYGEDFTTTEEFAALWDNDAMQKFRKVARRYPAEECQHCEFWQECGGGCLIRWMYWDPKNYVQPITKKGGRSHHGRTDLRSHGVPGGTLPGNRQLI